jgi:hypothetical protein
MDNVDIGSTEITLLKKKSASITCRRNESTVLSDYTNLLHIVSWVYLKTI